MNSKSGLLILIGVVGGTIAFILSAYLLGVDITRSGAENGGRGIAAMGIAVLGMFIAMAVAAPYIRRADRSQLAVGPRLLEHAAGQKESRYQAFSQARDLYLGYLREHQIVDLPFGVTPAQRAAARQDAGLAEAVHLFCVARDGAVEAGAQPSVAIAWYQIGLVYQLQGHLDKSAQALRSALDILDDLPQLGNDDRETLGNCHYALGQVALEQGDRGLARRELESALVIDTARHDRQAQAQTRAALARCGGDSSL